MYALTPRMFNTQECARLAHSALLVVTRREMSLNRRLFSWLSGRLLFYLLFTIPGGDDISDYFIKNSKEVVILAVKVTFLP